MTATRDHPRAYPAGYLELRRRVFDAEKALKALQTSCELIDVPNVRAAELRGILRAHVATALREVEQVDFAAGSMPPEAYRQL